MRLFLCVDKFKKSKPTVIQLAKGQVDEFEEKGHANVLKLTSTLEGEKLIYLALPDAQVYNKWYRKCKKV